MLCETCKTLAFSAVLKMCKRCRKTTDQDNHTLKYCRDCAKELGVCRGCGTKLTP